MKKIIQTLSKIIKSDLFKYAIIFLLIVIFVGTCNNNTNLRNKLKVVKQNVAAMTDSLKIEKKKNGETYASILGYQSSVKDLKLYNQKLYDLSKEQSGKLVTLNNLVFQLKIDTSVLRKALKNANYYPPVLESDSTYSIKWYLSYQYDSNNYDRLTGKTVIRFTDRNKLIFEHRYTELLLRETQIELTYGQKYEDGKLRVFVESKYPGFTPKSLEGVYVNYPKERKWFTGFGIGPSLNLGWNIFENKPALIIGLGFQYNIYKW